MLDSGVYLADTPGYGHPPLPELAPEELSSYFLEFASYRSNCHFSTCTHRHEPKCSVRVAVSEGKIDSVRYEHYCKLYQELEGEKRR